MKDIHLVFSSFVSADDISSLQAQLEQQQAIYNERLRIYNETLKTKDSLRIAAEYQILQSVESGLLDLKHQFEQRLSNVVSSGTPLYPIALDTAKVLQANSIPSTEEELQSSEVSFGTHLYPIALDTAKVLQANSIPSTKEELQSSVTTSLGANKKAAIQTTDPSRKVNEPSKTQPQSQKSWTTVALAGGVLVLAIISMELANK